MSKPNLASDSQAEFDQLQKKLVPLWKSIERFNQDPQTIVVVPSMSIDAIGSGAVMQAYEALRRDGNLPATFEVVYGHAWKGEPRRTADGHAIVTMPRPPRG